MQQGVEGRGVDRCDRLLSAQEPLGDGVHGKAHGGLGGALGVAGLQHVQPPLLHGELGVLHVAVVTLEGGEDLHQLLVHLRQPGGQLANVAGGAHPGDDVLPLGVGQEIA